MFPQDELIAIASSLVIGLFMLQLGLWTKLVTWRPPTRCPSCGRLIVRRRCRCRAF